LGVIRFAQPELARIGSVDATISRLISSVAQSPSALAAQKTGRRIAWPQLCARKKIRPHRTILNDCSNLHYNLVAPFRPRSGRSPAGSRRRNRRTMPEEAGYEQAGSRGHFKPGQSGNPGGRPTMAIEACSEARQWLWGAKQSRWRSPVMASLRMRFSRVGTERYQSVRAAWIDGLALSYCS
jgi:hypothetical protein